MTAPTGARRRPIEDALGLIKGRWTPAVLAALAAGPLRFSQLLAEINQTVGANPDRQAPLTEKVLTETLRTLETAQLVRKHREGRLFAASSWYELTMHGKTLLCTLRPLADWMTDYRAALNAEALLSLDDSA